MSLNQPPEGTFAAQQMALALQEYIEAAQAEQSAREKFDGHSWGYYGSALIKRRDRACNRFTDLLNTYVDERVLAIVKATQIKLP